MADKPIPALLRKDVVASPLPFKEATMADPLLGSLPTAPALNLLSQDERSRQEFFLMQQEAMRLKQQTGVDFAVGNAVCEACGNEFAAVAPASESVFPCPRCRTHRARWKFNFIKPGPHWACGCGSVTFRVAQTGVYCPQCGQDQELPGFVK
jgi:Zn finger protein HypA/HybF involved in hydrogenase expression